MLVNVAPEEFNCVKYFTIDYANTTCGIDYANVHLSFMSSANKITATTITTTTITTTTTTTTTTVTTITTTTITTARWCNAPHGKNCLPGTCHSYTY